MSAETVSDKFAEMTLLCVDDERIILRTLQRLFRGKPYKIITAESAKEALLIIEKTSVDVIVSDMRMPEMDGATLLEKIAKSNPETYRIVLSGFADFESTVAAINLGKIHRFVNKPWENESLVNAIEEGLHLRSLTKENQRLKNKIQAQNKLLKKANNNLEEKINLRTKQIKASLNRNQLNNKETEKMLFNFIGINPYLSAKVAKKVAQLSVRLGKEMFLETENINDLRLAAYLNEVGLLGLDPHFAKTPYRKLNYEQKELFLNQGEITQKLLAPSQRFNSIKEILSAQFYPLSKLRKVLTGSNLLACEILIIARDYWRFSAGRIDEKHLSAPETIDELIKEKGNKYSEELIDILIDKPELIEDGIISSGLTTMQLVPDMVLKESLFSSQNLLILVEGHTFTEASIGKLIEYETNQKEEFIIVIDS